MKTSLRDLAAFIIDADNGIEVHYLNVVNNKWHVSDEQTSWSTMVKYRRKPQQSGSDIVRELLKNGRPVLCHRSDTSQKHADNNVNFARLIISSSSDGFTADTGTVWRYASPIDTSTIAKWPEVEE